MTKSLAESVDKLLESAAINCRGHDPIVKLHLGWFAPDGDNLNYGRIHTFKSSNWNFRFRSVDDMLLRNRRTFPGLYDNV